MVSTVTEQDGRLVCSCRPPANWSASSTGTTRFGSEGVLCASGAPVSTVRRTVPGARGCAKDSETGCSRQAALASFTTSVFPFTPAEIAAKHAYAFELAVVNQSTATTADNRFAIDLNGVEKFASPTDRQMAMGEKASFNVEPGELKPGWNTINTRFLGSSGWITFDYYKFEISDFHLGMAIFIR